MRGVTLRQGGAYWLEGQDKNNESKPDNASQNNLSRAGRLFVLLLLAAIILYGF